MKQMIVIRSDLNMGVGKTAVQVAHASMKSLLENIDHPAIKEWLAGPFTKIAVTVDSEEALHDVMNNAKEAGIIVADIIDAGRTEFNGVPTLTCAAIGPATHEELSPITGHLKLR